MAKIFMHLTVFQFYILAKSFLTKEFCHGGQIVPKRRSSGKPIIVSIPNEKPKIDFCLLA
jgi:hypothetical protein